MRRGVTRSSNIPRMAPKKTPSGIASNHEANHSPPVANVPSLGAISVAGGTPASVHLLSYARALAEQGQYQFAAVFAHAACELHTESALISLLSARNDKVLARLAEPTENDVKCLDNQRVYRVYSALTKDFPRGTQKPERPPADWWNAWLASRQDRHDIAHKGAQVTREKANQALGLAEQYINNMTAKVSAALKDYAAVHVEEP
jgi:hypothetical protein